MRKIVIAGLLIPSLALADTEIRGAFDTQASYLLDDTDRYAGRVQSIDTVLSLELETSFSNGARLYSETIVRHESKDQLEPGKPSLSSRGKFNKPWQFSDESELELRELYIDGYSADIFFRLGKQQIVWGQSDGLQVLDVVNPMRYREFISDEIEDRRIPLWAANIEVPVGNWMLQMVWLPDQTYHVYPESGAAFSISSSKLSPSIDYTQPLELRVAEKPKHIVKDSDYGFRVTGFVGGWDVGLSYLYQYANNSAISQYSDGTTQFIDMAYKRTHLLGGSFAKAFSSFTLRGETAYISDSIPFSDRGVVAPNTIQKRFPKTREVKGVVGIDYNGFSDTLLSAQWFLSTLLDDDPAFARDKKEQQVTFLIRRDFMNQVLTIDGLAVHSLNDDDGYWHLAANYRYRANITFRAAFDGYYGSADAVFGQFQDESRFSLGLEYAF
ncbi:MAG: DUF1302 family protein [Pseudohongiellaceae bacterium]|nr:DUF1302 family protein [Pseudohongiellaceae bacterium]